MKPVVDPGDRDFLERVSRLGAASIPEICERMEVTATAIRQRLGRLQASGLVERETIRSGRGRPHHRYRVTAAGRRELGENYAELTQVLWRAIQNIDDQAVRRRTMESIRQSLIVMYGGSVHSLELTGRTEELRTALRDHGFDVDVDLGGRLPILRENNCPYFDLASEDRTICDLEQSVFQEILGTPLERTQCCLDGHHCCEFQPPLTGEIASKRTTLQGAATAVE